MALKFNTALPSQPQILSFDLDDTLYHNEEVIKHAEQVQYDTICRLVPEAKSLDAKYWLALKWQILKQQELECHDVTAWRRLVIKTGLSQFALAPSNLNQVVDEVFDAFYHARSDFNVPEQSFEVLAKLKEKYTLVAVTNGNADIERLGLSAYFSGYYRAGENNTRMKPYPDMLNQVAKDFKVKHKSIVHIGDNIGTDVLAAHRAGCPSFWFNYQNSAFNSVTALPTAEYSNLADLLLLL